MKKTISIILSVIMVIGTMSVGFSAYAASSFCIIKQYDAYDEQGQYIGRLDYTASDMDAACTVTNTFDAETGTLTINGTGEIPEFYLSAVFNQINYGNESIDASDPLLARCIYDKEIVNQINTEVKKLVIAEGITSVGNFAFDNALKNVETIVFPSTLKTIGVNAFAGCKALKAIHLPSGLETLGSGAFAQCDSLTDAVVPASVSRITVYERIYHYPESEQFVINSPFTNCKNLKTLTYKTPGSIIFESAENAYVSNCPSLETLVICGYTPSGTIIEDCTQLKSVYFLSKNNTKYGSFYMAFSPYATVYLYENNAMYKSGELDYYLNQRASVLSFAGYHFLDAPTAVTKLKAAKVGANEMKLSWNGNAKDTTAYQVQRYVVKDKKWKTIATVTGKSYTVKKLYAGCTYKFRVRAVNNTAYTKANGSYTKTLSATTTPAKVTGVKLKKSSRKIKISYAKAKGASSYQIYIKSGKNGKYKKLTTTSKKSYTTKKMKKGTYYIKVRARKKVSKGKYTYGAYSKEVKVKL